MIHLVTPVRPGQQSWVDRHWFVRLLEIIPGAITWTVLVAPFVLSLVQPVVVAYFIIAFDLYWMGKSFRFSLNLIRGYRRLRAAQQIDWNRRLEWVKDPHKYLVQIEEEIASLKAKYPQVGRWWGLLKPQLHGRYRRLHEDRMLLGDMVAHQRTHLDPDQLYHAVILATYNESIDILEPSVWALTQVDYPLKQLILIIAYEERGGEQTERNAHDLIERYGHHFAMAEAVKHPDGIAGEVQGKGGNITFAGRRLTEMVREAAIHPERVVVTTFDSDHRASHNYFSYLSFLYATDPNRVRKSFQPIPMFFNNIWDVPAPMRVIATGNSFWTLMETMRPHRLRNFAAHAQSLAALIVTDYWSVTTIVEDGHQFWRTYFAYDGDHQVVPVYTPIYQDAVLAETYVKTFKAQYKQIRRWAWGASDIQYAIRHAIANRRIPFSSKFIEISRLFDSHISWSTSAVLLTTVAWLPITFNHEFATQKLAYELPIITSTILQIASVGIIITVFISLISLPPRPKRYKPIKRLFMVLQWVLLPVTSIAFGSVAAIDAQTRLIIGRYLDFYVTEKATKK